MKRDVQDDIGLPFDVYDSMIKEIDNLNNNIKDLEDKLRRQKEKSEGLKKELDIVSGFLYNVTKLNFWQKLMFLFKGKRYLYSVIS